METINDIMDISVWVVNIIVGLLTITAIILNNDKVATLATRAVLIITSLFPAAFTMSAMILLNNPKLASLSPVLAALGFLSFSLWFIFGYPKNIRFGVVMAVIYGFALTFTLFASLFTSHLDNFEALLDALKNS